MADGASASAPAAAPPAPALAGIRAYSGGSLRSHSGTGPGGSPMNAAEKFMHERSLAGGRVPLYRAFNSVWSTAYLDLPDQAGETAGTPLAGEDLVAHGRILAAGGIGMASLTPALAGSGCHSGWQCQWH